MDQEAISAFFRNEFENEEKAGFPRLSRIPDTSVKGFLHCFHKLQRSEADFLKFAISKNASSYFNPESLPLELTAEESAAFEQMGRACAMTGDWQFTSLKTLKMAAGMSRSEHPAMKKQMCGFQIPDEVLRWLDTMTTCKAVELRRLVKLAFSTRFGFIAKNCGGGYWVYHAPGDNDSFEVEIGYGGKWGQQLRYSVYLRKRREGELAHHLRFESLFGAGAGDWDFITESSAVQDVNLLVELVEYVVALPKRCSHVG